MTDKSDQAATIRHYRRIARRIVSHYFGTPSRRIVYRSSGLTNYVFAINHADGQFVVRISPDRQRIGAFAKEWWASQQARSAGVPGPEILAVGDDLGPEPYMISRRVAGSEATYHPKRPAIIRELGRYASIINEIETTGFGANFDWNNEAPRIETWSDYLDREYQLAHKLEFFARHNIVPQTELTKLARVMEESRSADIRPSLNHSDLRLKNVIVDEAGEINAIIDWEESVSAVAPQWELAIALHDLSIDEKQAFLAGYGVGAEQLEQMSPLIKAFNILNYYGAVASAVEQNDQQKLTEARLRLNGTLDLFTLPAQYGAAASRVK